MSTPQNLQNTENEPKEEAQTSDELTGEQLDQVAGGGIEPSPWQPQGPQPGAGVNLPNQPNQAGEWSWGLKK